MTNVTTFYLLPATIALQERIDFELKICKLTGIKDSEGNLTSSGTIGYSNFIEHPENGTYIYAIDNSFNGNLTEAEKASCAPSLNFSTATDDTLYASDDPAILEYYPVLDLI